MLRRNFDDNTRIRLPVFGFFMIVYYALVFPSAVLHMIGIGFGVAMLFFEKKGILRWNGFEFIIFAFSLSYFFLQSVIGYSTIRSVAYGLTILMLFVVGYNICGTDDDYRICLEKIKKAIILVYYCLSAYIVLCAVYTFLGGHSIGVLQRNFYVVWNGELGNSTHFGSMSAMPLAVSIYLMLHKKGQERLVNGCIFTILLILNMIMANRVVFLFVIIFFAIGIICNSRGSSLNKKTAGLLLILLLLFLMYVFYTNNIFGIQSAMMRIPVFQRTAALNAKGYEDPRIERQLYIIQHFFEHTSGGGYYTETIGESHNVWLDIYDYAGMVPFIFFTIITIRLIVLAYKSFKRILYSETYGLIVVSIIAYLVSFAEEPVFRSCECYFVLLFFIMGMSEYLLKIERIDYLAEEE